MREYDLAAQFRCGGSRTYIDFIDYLFGFTAQTPDGFAGQYSSSLPPILRPGNVIDLCDDGAARLVAGFCWKWSDPDADSSLVDDVVIGEWRRPWNRKEAKGKTYKDQSHPYTLWATTAEGQEQVGCIYSAQGFEFERVGVIWGHDLVGATVSGSAGRKTERRPSASTEGCAGPPVNS